MPNEDSPTDPKPNDAYDELPFPSGDGGRIAGRSNGKPEKVEEDQVGRVLELAAMGNNADQIASQTNLDVDEIRMLIGEEEGDEEQIDLLQEAIERVNKMNSTYTEIPQDSVSNAVQQEQIASAGTHNIRRTLELMKNPVFIQIVDHLTDLTGQLHQRQQIGVSESAFLIRQAAKIVSACASDE